MKKLSLFLALLCALALPARAQVPPNFTYGGNITTSNANCISTACVQINLPGNVGSLAVTISGTFSGTLQFEQSADNGNNWTNFTSVTTTGLTQLSAAGLTNFRVRASAFVSGNAGVAFSASSATYASSSFSTLTGGTNTGAAMICGTGCSLAPSGTGTVTSNRIASNFGPSAIFATDYGVKADLQYITDATWTIGSGAVSSAGQANFTSADTGKACVGISTAGAATLPVGTFTYSTATTGTCSVVATASAAGTGTFAWATDDDTAAANAWAALVALSAQHGAGTCGGTIQWPAGWIWLDSNPAKAAITGCGQFDTMAPELYVQGQGKGVTNFFLSPSYGFNTTTAGGCRLSTNLTCLFVRDYIHMRGLSVTGLGFKNFTCSAVCNALALGTQATAEQTSVFAIGNGVSGWTGLYIAGQGDNCANCEVDSGGGMAAAGLGVECYYCFTNGGLNVASGSQFTDFSGFYNSNSPANVDGVTISGDATFFGTNVNENAARPACGINGGKLVFYGGYSTASPGGCNNANATAAGIYIRGNNSTVVLNGVTVKGGTGGTAGAINTGGKTGTRIIDQGFNTLTGTMANFDAAGGSWEGRGNGPNVYAYCTGVASAGATLGLRVTGISTSGAGVNSTCTSTNIDAGLQMQTAGTAVELLVNAGTAGVNASSGVFTVLKNGGATTMTCTVGTGTSCVDGTHTFAFVKGDLISVQFTTQAGETLGGIQAVVIAN